MNNLLTSSIKQLSKHYRNKSVDPVEIASQCIELAGRSKHLNDIIRLCPDRANKLASESSKRWKGSKPLGPLDGIPVAIKDNFSVTGVTTTCASKMLENFTSMDNATPVERLLGAGSVFIGKTNMDEFSMGAGAVDSIFGPTRNVWQTKSEHGDRWHIAGGSSGGSATAVANGTCFAALGSDTGGSVRNPASYCGVVGLKPTYGLVSRHGLIPLVHSMDVPGILTRSVDDCMTVLNAIAGPDELDSTCWPKPYKAIELGEADDISLQNIRIGIPIEYHCEGMADDVIKTWIKVADLLENSGAKVKQISLPNTEYSIFVYTILNQCEVCSNMARYDGIEYGYRTKDWSSTEQFFAINRQVGFNKVVKNRILTGNYFLLKENYEKYFLKALKVRRRIANDFEQVFDVNAEDAVDLILTPTTLTDAPLYDDFIKSTNRDQCAVQDFCTQPANMAGIPAVSIPIRLSEQGLPLSLQLMGPKFSEQQLLAVAKWIESRAEFPFFKFKESTQ